MKKIEIVTWYRCNCRCSFCSSPFMRSGEMSTRKIAGLLTEHKQQGVSAVDFGGGEPTVREDLPTLARAAVELGYTTVGVKSNGMRFCYPEYVELCMQSGINDFSISLWGFPEHMHDMLAGRRGAFEMTEMGLKHLVDSGANVCVDYLLTTQSLETLDACISHLGKKIGIKKIRLWLFSVFGAGSRAHELLPNITDAGKAIVRSADANRQFFDSIRTSHIPPCLLPGEPSIYYNIRDLDLLVITPGHSFKGEDSPFEQGSHVPECEGCRFNVNCAGPRREYIDMRGGGEIKAVR